MIFKYWLTAQTDIKIKKGNRCVFCRLATVIRLSGRYFSSWVWPSSHSWSALRIWSPWFWITAQSWNECKRLRDCWCFFWWWPLLSGRRRTVVNFKSGTLDRSCSCAFPWSGSCKSWRGAGEFVGRRSFFRLFCLWIGPVLSTSNYLIFYLSHRFSNKIIHSLIQTITIQG